MNQFLRSAVKNYHKLGVLKQQKFLLSQLWRSEVGNHYHWVKIKVTAELHSFWRLQRRLSSLPFPAPGDCQCSFWLVAESPAPGDCQCSFWLVAESPAPGDCQCSFWLVAESLSSVPPWSCCLLFCLMSPASLLQESLGFRQREETGGYQQGQGRGRGAMEESGLKGHKSLGIK